MMIYTIDYDPPEGNFPSTWPNPFEGKEYESLDAAISALGPRIERKWEWTPATDDYDFALGFYETAEDGCGSWVILGRA